MGCQANYVCITCRKSYYCGYGSYTNIGNRLTKAPQAEHEGHETTSYTEDFTNVDQDGDLCLEGIAGDEKWIIGYENFERIDLSLRSNPNEASPTRPCNTGGEGMKTINAVLRWATRITCDHDWMTVTATTVGMVRGHWCVKCGKSELGGAR